MPPRLAGLLLALVFAIPAQAEESESVAEMYDENIWLDDSVSYLATQLDTGANWFDSFFGDDRDDAEARASLYARWIQDFRFDQSDEFDYDTKFRAQAELPRFSRHMKLLIATDDEDIVDDELGTTHEQVNQADDDERRTELGLRYDLKDEDKSRLSLTGSLRWNPFTPRFKLRYRRAWLPSPTTLTRLTSTGYWDADEGFSTRLTWDLEEALDQGMLVRWVNSVEWSEEEEHEKGLNWMSQITHFEKLSEDKALALDIGAFGITRPDFRGENYRIRARYRSSFFRPWLFYELQPEIYWPQDERKEDCTTCVAMMFRLEIQFRKDEFEQEPPPEPSDNAPDPVHESGPRGL